LQYLPRAALRRARGPAVRAAAAQGKEFIMDRNTAGFGSALATGTALAITVGIGYAACALVFRAWPDASMEFMNALFHGLDFRKLASGPAPFEFSSFFYALFVAVVWAFALGALFGWVMDRFRTGSRP
jgi:hypothetical protein